MSSILPTIFHFLSSFIFLATLHKTCLLFTDFFKFTIQNQHSKIRTITFYRLATYLRYQPMITINLYPKFRALLIYTVFTFNQIFHIESFLVYLFIWNHCIISKFWDPWTDCPYFPIKFNLKGFHL